MRNQFQTYRTKLTVREDVKKIRVEYAHAHADFHR